MNGFPLAVTLLLPQFPLAKSTDTSDSGPATTGSEEPISEPGSAPTAVSPSTPNPAQHSPRQFMGGGRGFSRPSRSPTEPLPHGALLPQKVHPNPSSSQEPHTGPQTPSPPNHPTRTLKASLAHADVTLRGVDAVEEEDTPTPTGTPEPPQHNTQTPEGLAHSPTRLLRNRTGVGVLV